MDQEIINKLHAALYTLSPLASDRERIIAEMGETIWVLSLEKMLLALNEDKRKEVIECMNTDDMGKALDILNEQDIDIETILTEVATSVMDDVMATAKQGE